MNTIKLQFCLFIMNFLTPVQQKFIYHRMTVKLINIDKRKRSDQVLLRRSDCLSPLKSAANSIQGP